MNGYTKRLARILSAKEEAKDFISPSKYQIETFEPAKIETYIDGLNGLLNEKNNANLKSKLLGELMRMHKLLKHI